MDITKIDNNTLGIAKIEPYTYERLIELLELRTEELAAAQANLDVVNNMIEEADKLGIGVKNVQL